VNILGIHIGHDSSAAPVVDGKIVADFAEERFTRTKHYCGLPIASIDYCLKSQKLKTADIDIVAVPADSVPDLNFLLDLKGTKRERKTKNK
jgi:carbamoyltransferase